LDEISYGSYTHYEFDADASDEGSKDPKSTVTIINPVLAIVNAVQLQLHERLLQLSSFDTMFSLLGINCEAGTTTDGRPLGDAICAAIPNGIYEIPCDLTDDDTLGPILQQTCSKDTDGDQIPDKVVLRYEDGTLYFPEVYGEEPFPYTCQILVPVLWLTIDCADPLHLWKRAENFLLVPLAEKINNPACVPATSTTATAATTTTAVTSTASTVPTSSATSTTGAPSSSASTSPQSQAVNCAGPHEDTWYDDVPLECFCDGLTMTDTVNNLVFKGAHSGLLLALHHVLEHADLGALVPNFDKLKLLIPQLGPIIDLISAQLKEVNLANWIDQTLAGMGMDLLDLKHGKFGFFRGPNGSNATRSWWKINSGKYQFDLYNQITEFNGMTRLPENWWYGFGPTPSAQASGVRGICHDIIGTDGISYPPEAITKDDPIWIFNDQLSRSIWLNYVQEADVDGVTTYQYSPRPEVFAMTNPDNFCYCPKVEQCAKVDENEEDAWDISDCQDKSLKLEACIDGLLDLQGSYGVPIIMSTPHFLDADPSLHEAIDGVDPDREKHITFLNIEPTTGMSLQAHKRIQVSVPVAKSEYFHDLQNLRDPEDRIIWPVVWVDEGADATQENLDLLKSMLVTPFILVDVATGLLIGVGGVLILLAGALHFFCKR